MGFVHTMELASYAMALVWIGVGYIGILIRRTQFPVNGRDVSVLMMQGFGCWNGRAALFVRLLTPPPANSLADMLLVVWATLGVLLESFCFVSRLCRHLCRYKLTAAMAQYQETKRQDLLLHNWWVRHRRWLAPSMISRVVAADVVLCVLLLGGAGSATQSVAIVESFGSALMGFHLLLITVIGCWLWSFPADGFGIKLEMRRLTLWLGLMVVVFGVLRSQPNTAIDAYRIVPLLANLSEVVLTMICAYIPLVASMRRQSIADKLRQYDSDLERLLRDPGFCVAFLRFLQSEFSSENLLFWQALTLFQTAMRKHSGESLIGHTLVGSTCSLDHGPVRSSVAIELPGPPVARHARITSSWGGNLALGVRSDTCSVGTDRLLQEAEHLYETYLGPSAIQRVNLPGTLYHKIRASHEKVRSLWKRESTSLPGTPSADARLCPSELVQLLAEELDVLAQCGQAVLKLMTMDSLPRFATIAHAQRVAWFPLITDR